MISDKQIERYLRMRGETPNILTPAWMREYSQDAKFIRLADAPARAMAQNLIDELADAGGALVHSHLAEARILIVIDQGTAPKLLDPVKNTALIKRGCARKASPLVRMLGAEADFVITFSAAEWDPDDADDSEEMKHLKQVRRMVLVDHELEHCSFAASKKYVSMKKLDAFVQALGEDHIATDKDDVNNKGAVAVRFVKRRPSGPDGEIFRPGVVYGDKKAAWPDISPRVWRMRDHDVQDFLDAMGRWGENSERVRQVMAAVQPKSDGRRAKGEKEKAA
jgi:hypothetical protein